MDCWLQTIRDAKKTCFVAGGLKKVHYVFTDGREMAEEYNLETQMVTRRAWKVKKSFCGEAEWEIEVGDPTTANMKSFEFTMILESSQTPIMTKRITKISIEWRIRNLPYPPETYSVTADNDERCIVVKTTNKKYFKKIPVPDLDRLTLQLEQDRISYTHKFNTLIVSYKKPPEMAAVEKLVLAEINKLDAPKQEAVPCPSS